MSKKKKGKNNKSIFIFIIACLAIVGVATIIYSVFLGEKIIEKVPNSLLIEKAQVGDYVDYDAGVWDQDKLIPTSGESFTLGGYTNGSSRNKGVTCNDKEKLDGWRIIDIGDEQITLISAGIVECYYLGYSSEGVSKSLEVLKRDQYNDYVSEEYAVSMSYLTKDMVDKYIGEDSSYKTISDDLIEIGEEYFLASGATPYSLWYITENGYVANYHVGLKGVRVVITLKEEIRTTGKNKKGAWTLTMEK